ncbi:MAG: 2Fe-2S iron-sulfur cluster binding domain-containing protein [Pseudomonadota bacterium]
MPLNLNINGRTMPARFGDTLVDAALSEGVLIPHDCATGQCETCRVRVAHGSVDDRGTSYGDTVLACQARIIGDVAITMEELPSPVTEKGKVEAITELGPRVVELAIRLRNPFAYRPGQYARLTFAGFPARDYSFSAPMQAPVEADLLIFQIRILRQGLVSTALGKTITTGHAVKVSGPYGNAYLRSHENGPLVLTASGTGFGPIWALARAATTADRNRSLSVIAGIRTPNDAYMRPALDWLRDHGKHDITLSAREGEDGENLDRIALKRGEVDAHLPALCEATSLHVAGNPAMVERVKVRALAARARCYADPFTAATTRPSLLQRGRNILRRS